MKAATPSFDAGVLHLLRALAPQVVGVMTRRFGDFAAAEDAVQEALIAAVAQWPLEGVPASPRAWLIRVAARRITDHVRAETARRLREQVVVSLVPPDEQLALSADQDVSRLRDDTLVLLFMCCHPALSSASATALTLRAVGGLTTAEIAKAFFVPEATMAQRISRAKQSIKSSDVPFEMPTPEEGVSRLGVVLHVLYLIFNEGYAASYGNTLLRTDLSNEAMRLARLLHDLMPHDAEVTGLFALMLLTDARRAARTGPCGELIPLDEQDRALWDRTAIAEGIALVTRALSMGAIGEYQLQAAIAALHDEAPSAQETDWPQIMALYGVLHDRSDNPMVALNHAIALAMVRGAEAGLERLDVLARDPRLRDHHRIHAVRGHLLERAGKTAAAVACYRRASDLATNVSERSYLVMRAARCHAALRR